MFIKTLIGKTITIDVKPNTTCNDIKDIIVNQESEYSDKSRIRLIFCGKVCDDNKTVKEYKFSSEGHVHLVYRNVD
jgi:hypothetical protein